MVPFIAVMQFDARSGVPADLPVAQLGLRAALKAARGRERRMARALREPGRNSC
jgi:hypothetical protein